MAIICTQMSMQDIYILSLQFDVYCLNKEDFFTVRYYYINYIQPILIF